MKNTKHCFTQFSFYDRTGIRAFLERQAEQGWLLDKLGSFTWRFRRIEPKKLHFAVTYFPDASAFDPGPSEKQNTFVEFCAHAGWHLAGSSAQLQIFYTEAAEPVPIETDPVMEIGNIHKSAKKSFLVSQWILLWCAFVQLAMQALRIGDDLVGTLSSNAALFVIFAYTILALVCGMELCAYYRWRKKALAAAEEEGIFLPTKSRGALLLALLWLLIAVFLAMLCSLGSTKYTVLMLMGFFATFLTVSAVLGATHLMKKLGFEAKQNRNITIVLTFLLSFVIVGVIVMYIMGGIHDNWPDRQPVDTYEFQGRTYEIYEDDLPLTLEDLGRKEDARYSYQMETDESLLLADHRCHQIARWGENRIDWFYYTIVEVKAGFLYGPALNSLLDTSNLGYSIDIYGNTNYDEYRQVDAGPWRAEKVYQLYGLDEAQSSYLVCYDGFILILNPTWDMTAEEMAVVGGIFG